METKFSAEKRARYDAVANACLRKCHLQVPPIEKKDKKNKNNKKKRKEYHFADNFSRAFIIMLQRFAG